MLFGPSGLSQQDGPRTKLLRRRKMATCPVTQPCGTVSAPRACSPPGINPGAAEEAEFSRYKPGTGFGSALCDACNGFNEINCSLMLWNVAHRWNRASRFAFNRYRHWVRCLVWSEPGELALVIHSKEGITQEDCLAMSLYGVALMPLASKMRKEIPEALQPWYCNDAGTAGKALPNA
jgi:hypothetical protein